MKDTRDKNIYPDCDTIFDYLLEYAGKVPMALRQIGAVNIVQAHTLLKLTHARKGRVFVGGNGGSAAIADHLCCDFSKGTAPKSLIVHSLNGSMATFSAIGNDLGYEKTLSYQLELSKVSAIDTVILVSSSGNSRNVVDAAVYAKARSADVIGLTGFDGGELKKLATCSLHVPILNYGIVEDCHQVLMHVLAQFYHLSMNRESSQAI